MSRKKYQHRAPNQKYVPGVIKIPGLDVAHARIITLPRGSHPALSLEKLKALEQADPRSPRQRVPDGVFPIIAWRAWGVIAGDKGYALSGLGLNETWPAKKIMAAKCAQPVFGSAMRWLSFSPVNDEESKAHQAPGHECNCGVWAFRSQDELLRALKEYKGVRVIGQVYLWGRILECENGFRAQYAYPAELWLLDNSLEELGWTYNVPIRMVPENK